MYCHACGIALTQQTRYCNRCGAQLVAQDQTGDIKRTEKRLDVYLDGLFWITVLGLAVVLGGMVLMKKVGLSDFFILVYLVLSSTAFLINFVINLKAALRLGRKSRELTGSDKVQTEQLNSDEQTPALPPATSITDRTTRSFDRIRARRNTESNLN